MESLASPGHSDASTAMSEFVRRMYDETASRTSVTRRRQPPYTEYTPYNPLDIAQAVSGIDAQLRRLERKHALLADVSCSPELSAEYAEPTEAELDSVLALDDAKLRLILDATLVESHKTSEYMRKFRAIQDGIRKKRKTEELMLQREIAHDLITFKVTDEEILSVYDDKRAEDVETLAHKLGAHTDEDVMLVKRACVHDSVFQGRDTNRMLALIGDAALAVMLKEVAVKCGATASKIDQMVKFTQSNDRLRDICVKLHLHRIIITESLIVDSDSRVVAATFVEALFGVAYIIGGMKLVHKLNRKHIKVCVFEQLFANVT